MSPAAFSSLSGNAISADLLRTLSEEVSLVEAELERQVDSQVKLVREVGSHTLRAGGKRLRPALVGLMAQAILPDAPMERCRRLGACMELIHMATLLHDDVIDNAVTRRGVETASTVFGNTASILSGDVLLSKAMSILAEDGDLAIIRNVSRAVVDLAEGEVRELQSRGVFGLTQDEHFEILRQKTATFIQSCCEVGALAVGADELTVESAGSYGYHIGMAFQMADDLLDYRGQTGLTGKPKATDFREGCATLPLILLRDRLSPSEEEHITVRFGNGVTDDELRMICSWMADRGVFEMAEEVALDYAGRAKAALQPLPDSERRGLLEAVADFVVGRHA